MIKRKTNPNKQQMISEYLSGKESYLSLEKRYGIKARTIQTWVRAFRKHHPAAVDKRIDPSSPGQLAALNKKLEHTQLKNELLQEMLRLAEQHTGAYK